jgi:hypothetical protein
MEAFAVCNIFFRGLGRNKRIFLIPLLLVKSVALSQPARTGGWLMYFGQLRTHEKWSLHYEGQYRDYGIADEAEQILLRGGLNFHSSPQSLITAGYAHVTSYPDDDQRIQGPSVSENRIWQQLLLRSSYGRIRLEHRYRLEQRWLYSRGRESYFDRIRYLVRVTIPLGSKDMEKGTLFLSLYDELFLNFTASVFDRNRLYGALGYQISPLISLQAGYLAQTVGKVTKHYLQLGLFHNIDVRAKK